MVVFFGHCCCIYVNFGAVFARLIYDQIILSSVMVAEWPPFGKILTHSVNCMLSLLYVYL